jgi:hypothetical protein
MGHCSWAAGGNALMELDGPREIEIWLEPIAG